MPYNSQWTGQQIDDAIGKVRDNTVNALAVNVSFTPGDSGLGSTNVQDALEELAGRPSGGGSPRTYRVVVGTSTAGWTEDDCDFLCDGTTDQTTISQAIAALPEEGGVVYFLDGVYSIGGYLGISKDNVTLLGNHQSSVLSYFGSVMFLSVSGDNVTIEGLVFQDSRTSGQATVTVSGAGFQIKNCKFTNTSVPSMTITGTDALLLGTDFTIAQIGTANTHNGARIYRCSCTGSSGGTQPWLNVSGDDIVIDGCYVRNVYTGVRALNSNRVTISNNYFNTVNNGIMVNGSVIGYNIINNVVLNYSSYGIYTQSQSSQYINVTGNYVALDNVEQYSSGYPIAIAGEHNVITSNITPGKEITTMGSRVLIDNNSY